MLTNSLCHKSGNLLHFAGVDYTISRSSHGFGLKIAGPVSDSTLPSASDGGDYLHQHLLAEENRALFIQLVVQEGLVICQHVESQHPSYRKVRGKSSSSKLSQAEYYHHDGCSCPQNPRLVEIRLPHQPFARNVATAIAPFPAVIRGMLQALPKTLVREPALIEFREQFEQSPYWKVVGTTGAFDRREAVSRSRFQPEMGGLNSETNETSSHRIHVENWDTIQGHMIRLVRREMDAESCRAYYREVDQLAGAYAEPWQMGESRFMLNFDPRPEITLQHRRAFQKIRERNEQNGHLVKRWTAEEL